MLKGKETFGKVLHYMKHYVWLMVLSVILAMLVVGLTLYFPILTGNAIDLIIAEKQVSFELLKPLLVRGGIIIVLTALLQWILNMVNNAMTYRVVRDIRRDAFCNLQKLPLSYIDSHSHGDLVSRLISDVDTFADGLLLGVTQLFTGVATILGTLVFMFRLDYRVAIVVVVVTPLSLFAASFIAKRTYSMFKEQSETRGKQTALVQEAITNQNVITAFGKEEEICEKYDAINSDLGKFSLRATFFSSLVNPTTRFVNAIVYAGVAICGALIAIFTNGITVGQLTCFLSYANQYTKPFNDISSVLAELENALVSAERLFELIEETPESMGPYQMNSEMKPETDRETDCKTDCETDRGTDADSLAVEFSDVSFAYDPSEPLIEHLNLQAKPGQHIAIVGRTGCGKTTLINLLMRFYDVDGGVIRVGGTDIREMDRSDLRKRFGMVLQDTWLREGTVRENLLIGKPDATETEIERAARETRAHDFIKRLPKGYDTLITEGGGNLSQGQRQLLCITRVMLADPEMLILDEATSSVDTRTEIKIQAAFDRLMRGRTSFIVAHRLSTIRHADCIVVMDRGHVVEMGTHESLMAKKGQYYMLYESQFKGVAV